MSTIEDEHEIYRNIVRFARAMDDRDWAALDAITDVLMTADLGTGRLVDDAARQAQPRLRRQCGRAWARTRN